MIPAQQQIPREPKISELQKRAASIAARNIANWFNVITPDQLAEYAVKNTDVAGMLPAKLEIPSWILTISRWPLLIYLRGTVHNPRRGLFYEEIRRQLADVGYNEHCLLLAWGTYTEGRVKQIQLNRFPCLEGLSSVLPWYHANMDRVLVHLINQLEGGEPQHDAQPADGPDDTVRGVPDSGGGVPGGVFPPDQGATDFSISSVFSDDDFGGDFDSY